MTAYYYRISEWGNPTPTIIDESTLEQAEKGLNYLNPDEFNFLCEAESLEKADEIYWDKVSRGYSYRMAESMHP